MTVYRREFLASMGNPKHHVEFLSERVALVLVSKTSESTQSKNAE